MALFLYAIAVSAWYPGAWARTRFAAVLSGVSSNYYFLSDPVIP